MVKEYAKGLTERTFGPGKSILYAAIIVTFLLVCLELSIRTWAYFYRDTYEKFDIASQTFKLIPGEHRVGNNIIKINSDGFIGKEIQKNNPDLFRILTIGDSCTFGDGDYTTAYPALLESQLKKQENKSALQYEVINGGVEGLNSEMALYRLRSKGPGLSPDIVTIYIGWNDLMKLGPAGQGGSQQWSWFAHTLDKLWITKGVRKLVYYYIRPRLISPAVGPDSRTGAFKGFKSTLYEDNLQKIIASARSLGAKPVLLTLPTVLREGMTAQDIIDSNVVFPYFAAAYGVGDLIDLVEAHNNSIKSIASIENVPLVDLSKVFSSLEDPQEYFYDTMHASLKGRRIIANEIYSSLYREKIIK